ncbi:hypothetical protein E1B28_005176 [Marasmius oreades]|uniref:Uncharacterized protein n=1 Tax=Marasmius oreades TaxID=181124 RepID=A0A9P7V072_9AGAR|nr:uncharacterized protein E1B28_005176 [Marasmius oreades]KAG7097864.1 hypothetical protein E1B28_005176 [Marasmius oreades]
MPSPAESPTPPPNQGSFEEEMMQMADLWTLTTREISLSDQAPPEDYYEEYIRALETGEVIFCQLPS